MNGVRSSRLDQRSKARQVLERALSASVRCGSRRVAAQARAELLALGVRTRQPYMSGIEALTPSERRVAEMAAAGPTNREIAEALFVTEKTVESHLSSVYGKLGIRSRRELPKLLGGQATEGTPSAATPE